jgi:hypothetical protein
MTTQQAASTSNLIGVSTDINVRLLQLQNENPNREYRISSQGNLQRLCGNSWTTVCTHDIKKSNCKQCEGASVCTEHGTIRSRCKICRAADLCEHGNFPSECYRCEDGTAAKCIHQVQAYYCVPCKGAGLCKDHLKRKGQCAECGDPPRVVDKCSHGKRPIFCVVCDGKGLCECGKNKYQCRVCNPSDFCKHGRRRRRCQECKDRQ